MDDIRRIKPEDLPGARVERVTIFPKSHDPRDVAQEIAEWIQEITESVDDGFIRHLVITPPIDKRLPRPNARRYNARVIIWPWPPKPEPEPSGNR